MDNSTIAKYTGFEVCEFGPDKTPCENCEKAEVQLYFRQTSYLYNEGEYYCRKCAEDEATWNKEALDLIHENDSQEVSDE